MGWFLLSRRRIFLVVVGYDGSEQSDLALRRGIEEARLRDGEIHVVHVEDVTPAVLHLPDGVTVSTLDLAATRREEVWAKAAPLLDFDGPISRVDLDGYPADELVDYCAEVSADLLVMGTRGRGRLASTFLGSPASERLSGPTVAS